MENKLIALFYIFSINFLIFSCSSGTNVITNEENCGNAVLDSFESCDSDEINCTDIDSTKYKSGKAPCNSTCDDYDTSSCLLAINDVCGNGVIENDEFCDKNEVDCSTIDSKFVSGTASCKNDCTEFNTSTCQELNQINKMNLSITTSTFNGKYSPRNVLAIWIEDNSGNYIKTLLVKAFERRSKLSKWSSASSYGIKGVMVDTITSATRSMHGSETATWNLLDLNDNRVSNGRYIVWFEMNEADGASKRNSAEIEIGVPSSVIKINDSQYLKNIDISFE